MNIRDLTTDSIVDGRYRVLSRIGSGGMADGRSTNFTIITFPTSSQH